MNPFITILVILTFLGFFSYNIQYFELDASSDSLLLQDDEDLRYYRNIKARYGDDEFLVVTISPKIDLFDEKTIDLFEAALAVFDIKITQDIVNIGEALGCAKQYHRSLYQAYRLNDDLYLKHKQDSIFKLSKKLWVEGIGAFKSKNPNQLISLYGLSPFTERIYQLYHEYKVLGIGDLNAVFLCKQQLKY